MNMKTKSTEAGDAAWEREWERQFSEYLDLAIKQGWSDPVSFALRRMKEWEDTK